MGRHHPRAYVKDKAYNRRPVNYTEINAHLHRKGLPYVEVTRSPERRGYIGKILGKVNDLERAEGGPLLAAYVTYSDGTMNSYGFDNYVLDNNLLPQGVKMAVFKSRCYDEVVAKYGKTI